jgi:DNA (cytosine-5)-methyltransferase 1
MSVQAIVGGETAWVSDIDKGACKILAHRFPGVPNIGDMTTVDWSQVEPVDVLTAGYPCQPFSVAGGRKGTTDARHLWPHVREAIRHLRPRLTVLENVAGHRSLGFDRVLGDLAEDGMHVQWVSVRASDSGAPHRRERLFIAVGHPDQPRLEGWQLRGERPGERPAWPAGGESALLPTPVADHSRGLPSAGTDYQSLPNAVCALLPTPAVNDMGASYTPDEWDAWTERMKAAHGNGNGHAASLNIEAQRLLPASMVGSPSPAAHGQISGQYREQMAEALQNWGQYAAAITRWEHLTRPAPAPTETGPKGNPRLSAAFSEWMMGLPAGWVTDVPGITRNEALRALGNGVVPQQAEAAVRHLLAVCEAAA